ncbi:acetate--CoA ligase family protein [Variovorax terrae]|uniref:Acetate--CoA ligase family protein n=1 Tax=Variovorax terrae TaxID=2923278 RepID=A0A9X2AQQ6_9BURK|nr:acetate--CoA ligase family protein [Variovorax terrae]MCJ0763461.1 acetate--CoA ligase family protein [Variovorax terrae]
MSLNALLNPSSVAVVGASSRAGALGQRVLDNLQKSGFMGAVYPIHPSETRLAHWDCFPTLDALPEAPECVAIGLAAERVLPILEQAANRGAKAAVVFASGFSEVGEQGQRMQKSLADFCRSSGMKVCGPNVLGVRNLHRQFALYSAPLAHDAPRGGVAIAAHSGSACVALSGTGRFGLSHVVSMGNSAVLDVEDYLEHFAGDPNTRVACLFLEAVRNPGRLAASAMRMRAAGKPVLALKVGRTAKGAAASAAHTGSLAASHAAASDFFRQAGIEVFDDLDELIETCALFDAVRKAPSGNGLAVINISGGEVALTCDLGHELGLSLPSLSEETSSSLSNILPSFGTVANPLDATSAALSDPSMYAKAMTALLDDPGVGLLAVSQDCPAGLSDAAALGYGRLAQTAVEIEKTSRKPVVFYSNVSGPLHAATVEPLRGSPVPCLQGARPALVAVRAFLRWHGWTATSTLPPVNVQPIPAWQVRLAAGDALSEAEAKRFLHDHGVRIAREATAGSVHAAVGAADEIGYPVVLKVDSPDIPHKSDAGGVALSLRNAQEVATAFDHINESVRRHHPGARIHGVVVQEMVRGGVEMIIGTTQHPPFGRGVVVGAGGVLVELMNDSAFALTPIDHARASDLVGQTRAARLLAGYRGEPEADRPAFEELLVKISAIAEAYADSIETIELNPVAVLPVGQGACPLDALIIPRKTDN